MSAPLRNPRRLPQVHTVMRHPQDGWCMADPAPLSRASQRALRGVIRALLPPPPAPRPADIETRVEDQVRRMMQYMPRALRLGFVLLLHLLDWSPLWRLRGLSRLSRAPVERASAVFAGLAQSRLLPIRMMTLAPKALVLSAYFDQDEVHRALDYDPLPFFHEGIAKRAEWLAREGAASAHHEPPLEAVR
jgi:hypothetical protein